jgi:hypothetical protein
MIKLLICTVSAALLAACVLQLRQQRQALAYQQAELHDRIKSQQAKLWDQQLRIASYTSPNAISHTVDSHKLDMVPQAPLPNGSGSWIERLRSADGSD